MGYGPAFVEADGMGWSMARTDRALACSLLGREDVMLPIRKAAGVAEQRFGDTMSHDKALYSFADPGRDAPVSLIAWFLQKKPQRYAAMLRECVY